MPLGDVLHQVWKWALPVILTAGAVGTAILTLLKFFGPLRQWRKGWLSRCEKELLAAAASGDGTFVRLSVDQLPDWIMAGDHDFMDEHDPAVSAAYIEALERLVIHGCARFDCDNTHTLTAKGWRLGRKYARKKRYQHG